MGRIAVFVDAGYFWVQCSQLLYGEKKPRASVDMDSAAMRGALLGKLPEWAPGSSLLRVYWYDGLGHGNQPTPKHHEIAMLDDFKIRYGTINSDGRQKAVDGLIIADLLQLAQNKAIDSALIISGDADLAPGVTAAQMLGVRIHLLEIGPRTSSSPNLLEAADRKDKWDDEEVRGFLKRSEYQECGLIDSALAHSEADQKPYEQESGSAAAAEPAPASSETKADENQILVNRFIDCLSPEQIASIKNSGSYLEPVIDKALINFASDYLGTDWIMQGPLIDLRVKLKKTICQS